MEADLERAMAAANRASRWHQGSGSQADMAAGMAEQHAEKASEAVDGPWVKAKHAEAVKLWADATEADADFLEKQEGSWEDDEGWAAAVGPIFKKAYEASKSLGMDVSDWDGNLALG